MTEVRLMNNKRKHALLKMIEMEVVAYPQNEKSARWECLLLARPRIGFCKWNLP